MLFLAAVYFSNVCLLNSVLFFLPLILKGFGMGPLQTGLVAAIPSLFALIAVIWWGRRSDRRWSAPATRPTPIFGPERRFRGGVAG